MLLEYGARIQNLPGCVISKLDLQEKARHSFQHWLIISLHSIFLSNKMSESLVLGYWNVKGRAEFIRLLLSYLNLPFTEKVYIHGPPPENDVSSWFNEKFSIGMELPNLPYLIDGDYKISESLAIARYICNKYSPI